MTNTRYFEDLTLGEKFDTETYTLTAEKVHDFASEYDPQFIHVSEEDAKEGPFGTIIASGWQTLSATMRLMALIKPFGQNPLIGMRIDGLKFAAPVFPGETVTVKGEIVELTKSRTAPRGYVGILLYTINLDTGKLVATQKWTCLVPCREK